MMNTIVERAAFGRIMYGVCVGGGGGGGGQRGGEGRANQVS